MTIESIHEESPPESAVDAGAPWLDPTGLPADRVESLLALMTPAEKVAQLYGVWVGASADGGDVAPHQHELAGDVDLDLLLPAGLGQLTRPFGTAPVDPTAGAISLMRSQRRIADSNRFGIPAIAHEECLAGFAAWGATVYPVPLSWAASFDPELVREMAAAIGHDLRSVGIHQGLAPVLDVVRDLRWGRVEETMGEDPFLVGTVGAAYVTGLQSAGVIATVKHFVGYSASRAGRNLAPVSIGPRELADVLLPPFEMALRAGVRSVMNSYTDLDGVPTAADRGLLTELLRDTWGFDGTVVADYFSVEFLHRLHRVVDSLGAAGVAALTAGIDVELPTVRAYGAPLLSALDSGLIEIDVVDTAVRRVLRQKSELGLLDADWTPVPPALNGHAESDSVPDRSTIALDPPGNRLIAARLAEEAVVLVRNDGLLPLTDGAGTRTITVLGPNADDVFAMFGCYSFPAHIGVQHPDTPLGIEVATVSAAVRAEFPGSQVRCFGGTSIDGGETDSIAAAAQLAADSDVVVLALGDRSGLFGRGTSGEGCDAPSLRLPGAQHQLLEAVLDAGRPVVVVLLAGRPYALGTAPDRASAILQTFFPGEEGARAIAGVLSGRVNPSGRLPVGIPASPDSQPATYLASTLGRNGQVSTIDPTPAFAFGHGLGYSSWTWSALECDSSSVPVDGVIRLWMTVANTGSRDGVEVVQFYLADPVSSVVQPERRLVGFARVPLAAGGEARIDVEMSTDLVSFTARDGRRVVEPGEIVLAAGRSSADLASSVPVQLTGVIRTVDHRRHLWPTIEVH